MNTLEQTLEGFLKDVETALETPGEEIKAKVLADIAIVRKDFASVSLLAWGESLFARIEAFVKSKV